MLKFLTTNTLPKNCKSQFSELFKNCENTILSEISTIIMGQSPDSASYNDDGNGLPFFQGKADFGEKYTEVKHFTTDPSKIAEQGDTLISVRAPVGPVNVASVKCCIGRGLAAIRAKDQVATNEFIYEMLRSKEEEIASMGTGSTFKAINKNNLYNLEVPSAPLSLQNRFADFVKHIDKSKFELKQALENVTKTQKIILNTNFSA